MNDFAAVYHWQPSELDALDWSEFLIHHAEMPRVLKAMHQH